MPSSAGRQSLAFVARAEIEEKGRGASWPFALMLLGLAAVLIATAAEYPDFFAVGLDHLRAEVP
jgi:hypothetical protein